MFGKILRTVTVVAIFAGFTCAAHAQTRVACVGNSITEGYGIWDQKKYPDHLQEMLGEGYSVQNFGVSSMTFANKGPDDNMSYWNTAKFKAALEFNPEIVVIELGTNDSKFFTNNCIENGQATYNYNYGQYEKEQLYRDYEALLDTFMHLPANPKVYATLQPYSNNCGWGIMDTAIVNQINPIIQEVATRKGVEIIDLHSQFNTPEWFLADSVHPNATGAKELARIIKEGILKTPADTSKTPADTVPEVSDSTGTEDSTTVIRGNAQGFAGQDAQGWGSQDAQSLGQQDARRFDMQGRTMQREYGRRSATPLVQKKRGAN
jgi:lysophospholipase L1-like esterase